MAKKILWSVGASSLAFFNHRIAEILESETGVEVTFISPHSVVSDDLQRIGRRCFSLKNLLSEFSEEYEGLAFETLIQKAHKALKILDLNMLLHADASLTHGLERQVAQEFIARTILVLSRFLQNEKFDICLKYAESDAFHRALSLLAASQGVRVASLGVGPKWGTCVLFDGGINEQWNWSAFAALWEQRKHIPLSVTEKRDVDLQVEAMYDYHRMRPRLRAEQSSGMAILRGRGAKQVADSIKEWALLRRESASPPLGRDEFFKDIDTPKMKENWIKISSRVKARWKNTYPNFKYDKPPLKYIYMPFNLPWDLTSRATNPMTFLQDYLATVAHCSLPVGYELVIKEHPYTQGDPSHEKLRRLQKLGIKVMDPHVHSHELIKGAAAIFCIGEITGWEGILYKRPVIVFGAEPFYVQNPEVWKIVDPNQVNHAFREAVSSEANRYNNQDLWYSFIACALASCHPGNVFGYKSTVWTDVDNSKENTKNIAAMLMTELGLEAGTMVTKQQSQFVSL